MQRQSDLFAAAAYDSKHFEESIEDNFPCISTSAVVDNHSYDPYLIDYNEISNTFTYNDPWISKDQANDSNCNISEINISVKSKENHTTPTFVHIAHAPVEPASTPEVKVCDHIRDDHETNAIKSGGPKASCNVTAEHVPKVSFPNIKNNNRR